MAGWSGRIRHESFSNDFGKYVVMSSWGNIFANMAKVYIC